MRDSTIEDRLAAKLGKIEAAVGARWVQLGLGIVAMMTVSCPQYLFTLFIPAFQSATGGDLAAVKVTFTLLLALQCFLSPLQGWLIERFGSSLLIAFGAELCGLGWFASSYVNDVTCLYLTYGLFCGLGAGLVVVGIIGHMLAWFPQRRGLAAGAVAAGYGLGGLIMSWPIESAMNASGYRFALAVFGLMLGGIGILAAFLLRMPRQQDVGGSEDLACGLPPSKVLASPIFWLMFFMVAMLAAGGMMLVSQFAAFAGEFGIDGALVFGMAALPLALTLNRMMNGLAPPLFGWASDRIGRENTMALAFGLEAVGIALLLAFRHDAMLVTALFGLFFFGAGEILSLFPSSLTDTFGAKHAAANFGLLYAATGIGAILGGPIAALLRAATASSMPTFGAVIAMNVVACLLALLVLKPLRAQRAVRGANATPGSAIARKFTQVATT